MDTTKLIAAYADVSRTSGPNVPSPCSGVCRLVAVPGGGPDRCAGCLRTVDEVVRWPRASDAERRAIWHAVAERARQTPSLDAPHDAPHAEPD